MAELIEKQNMDYCTEKQWEKWWWAEYNELCKKCIKTCKQSYKVKLSCKEFKNGELNV
ncbi:MAG: hypothetical protein PHF86_12170 [Candidatus Nanoarchaeia archaeon]|jgi:hypothetical protein|nr:hypothetical protein [Candidatus Nanoarchaeia archaeon]